MFEDALRPTHQDLVQKVLDKLLFEGPRGEQSVQVCPEELCDKVNVLQGTDEDV